GLSNANAAASGAKGASPQTQPLRTVPAASSAAAAQSIPAAPAVTMTAATPTPKLAATQTLAATPGPAPTVPVAARVGTNDAYAEEHARRYARLLIADIRLYNEAAVRTGREQRDLAQRLQQEIARARQAFEERVPASVRDRER